MTFWVEIATLLGGIAALWTITLAWGTYVTIVIQHNKNQYTGLKSLVQSLRSELDFIKPWTGADGDGYLRTMKPEDYPPDWRNPSRLIWTFDCDAIRQFLRSPHLHDMAVLVAPLVRLNYSVSRIFQFYEEYRRYVVSRPDLYDELQAPRRPPNLEMNQRLHSFELNILNYNKRIHIDAIGGKDSPDPNCLYNSYRAAREAVAKFDEALKRKSLPRWFLAVHILSVAAFLGGVLLLSKIFLLQIDNAVVPRSLEQFWF